MANLEKTRVKGFWIAKRSTASKRHLSSELPPGSVATASKSFFKQWDRTKQKIENQKDKIKNKKKQ